MNGISQTGVEGVKIITSLQWTIVCLNYPPSELNLFFIMYIYKLRNISFNNCSQRNRVWIQSSMSFLFVFDHGLFTGENTGALITIKSQPLMFHLKSCNIFYKSYQIKTDIKLLGQFCPEKRSPTENINNYRLTAHRIWKKHV